ncbi:MAG: preprotein translocase subunit YajC [Acidimicrobiales bacterium]
MSFLIIIILFAIAWVVLILPKQREVKRHGAFVQSLAIGDEVMTGSGIYGTLVEVDDATVVLQVAPGFEMKVARRAIASRVAEPESVLDDADSRQAKEEPTDEAPAS